MTTALFHDHALARNLVVWLGLVLVVAGLAGAALTRQFAWLVMTGTGTALAVLVVLDLTQTTHSLRRNFPGSARLRWFFESLRPFSRSYLVDGDLDGRPFSHEERDLVDARAHGAVDAHPFGTELDVYSNEYEWLAQSMLPNPDADATIRALHEIIVASGLDSPSDLRPFHLRQRINAAEMRQLDEIYRFARASELIEGTDDPYSGAVVECSQRRHVPPGRW